MQSTKTITVNDTEVDLFQSALLVRLDQTNKEIRDMEESAAFGLSSVDVEPFLAELRAEKASIDGMLAALSH